jgi:hypothetical protein
MTPVPQYANVIFGMPVEILADLQLNSYRLRRGPITSSKVKRFRSDRVHKAVALAAPNTTLITCERVNPK